MIERIKAIMNHYNLSVNAFSAKIGANQVTINQQVNGDRKVSLDTILKIVNSFDLISSQWLLTGKGEMLKSPLPKEEPLPVEASIIEPRLLTLIESQQRTIEKQASTIENLSKK